MPMNPRLMRPLARRQAPAPAATDPYFSSVSLLLGMNGAGGASTFTDLSPHAHAVSVVGTVQLDSTAKKFGTASAGFSESGYLSVAAHSSLDMGTGDFTIEYWAKFNSPTKQYPVHVATTSTYQEGVFAIGYGRDAGNMWVFHDTLDSAYPDFYSSVAVPSSSETWRHIAFCRTGSDVTVYVDGAALFSGTIDSSQAIDLALGGVGIGGGSWDGSDSYTADFIDELRITKGVARYTAAFDVPTSEFPRA